MSLGFTAALEEAISPIEKVDPIQSYTVLERDGQKAIGIRHLSINELEQFCRTAGIRAAPFGEFLDRKTCGHVLARRVDQGLDGLHERFGGCL